MATPEQLVAALVVSFPGLAVGLERLLLLRPKILANEKLATEAKQIAETANAAATRLDRDVALLQQARELRERVQDEVSARRADAGPAGLSSSDVEVIIQRVLDVELRDIRREQELMRAAAARDKEVWGQFLERFGEFRGEFKGALAALRGSL